MLHCFKCPWSSLDTFPTAIDSELIPKDMKKSTRSKQPFKDVFTHVHTDLMSTDIFIHVYH